MKLDFQEFGKHAMSKSMHIAIEHLFRNGEISVSEYTLYILDETNTYRPKLIKDE